MSEDSNLSKYADRMENSTFHMGSLIDDLLAMGTLESGNLIFKPTTFDLADLWQNMVSMYQTQLDYKDLDIHSHMEPDCFIYADQERLQQVIGNLMSNAIKYSPYGTSIWVYVNRIGDKVWLRVRDEGLGLNEDDLNNLFQPFKKLSARPTDREPSTGLGLFIAQQFVVQQGGRIWADSEGVGHGCIFFVEFPYYSVN